MGDFPGSYKAVGPGLEVGTILAAIGNGVLILQMVIYFQQFRGDPKLLKITVSMIWLASICLLILDIHVLYSTTVTNHGTPIKLVKFPISFAVGASVGAAIHSSIQAVYTYRLFKFTGNIYLPAICWVLSIYVLGSGITFSVLLTTNSSGVRLSKQNWSWLFYSSFGVASTADLLIASSMFYYLRKGRNSGVPQRTRQIVDKLMVWTVETGFVTSIMGVCVVIIYVAYPRTNTWIGLYLPLTVLYPITMIALLNSRVSAGQNLSLVDSLHFPTILTVGDDDEKGVISSTQNGSVTKYSQTDEVEKLPEDV
ncbi:hypothetical protein BD779DRAFT_448716 [Infundibulicybe gibba]|nr:hypothetical protein BD779DRAFT_448716 [Infundibulicybe gibba]